MEQTMKKEQVLKRGRTGKDNTPITQEERIVNYLKTGKTLTSLDAFKLFGVSNVPKTISILRLKHKVEIIKTRESGYNRFGEPVSYMRYSLDFDAEQPEWVFGESAH